jgi:hypothetical protein
MFLSNNKNTDNNKIMKKILINFQIIKILSQSLQKEGIINCNKSKNKLKI